MIPKTKKLGRELALVASNPSRHHELPDWVFPIIQVCTTFNVRVAFGPDALAFHRVEEGPTHAKASRFIVANYLRAEDSFHAKLLAKHISAKPELAKKRAILCYGFKASVTGTNIEDAERTFFFVDNDEDWINLLVALVPQLRG